ncbi:RNA-binding domain-containing protein [Artomyces pyxidatus]|uniref:RNA-binding domain-containing protein n=1 Tax=Artomyces pyxidatus TaxID=48021 RepID=A0ACB8TKA3_9AGAM|nr:RNA-binding domain-containing protein [Artomyces pyxidatus]
MSTRGRSTTPPPVRDVDVEMENGTQEKPDARVVVVTNLSRNVVEAHLQAVFGFYGEIVKVDLPVYGKSGQNRGKAALEYADPASAHKAASHMNGGQLDGAVLKVELSDLPVRTRSRSPFVRPRNGRERPRSISRSRSRSRSPKFPRRDYGGRFGDSFRRPPPRRAPVRDTYRPLSRSRSRSPIRRAPALGPRRRSPSYERGGYGRRGRSRSASYSSLPLANAFALSVLFVLLEVQPEPQSI